MLKTLSKTAGMALSFMTILGTADAGLPLPMQCWPDCQQWEENAQCVIWFGQGWYYCGWNDGWTYCCLS